VQTFDAAQDCIHYHPRVQRTSTATLRLSSPPSTKPTPPRPSFATRLGRNRRRQSLLAFSVYLLLAIVITWPWITDPGDIVYGTQGGDLTSSIAPYQQFAENLQPPFVPGNVPDLNAPEGLGTSWALALAGVASSSVLFGLSVLFGSVAAHGIVAVGGFVLSAFAMFLLVRRITASAGAAFVVGLAFGFWPFTYETGWTWPHYIHLWVLVVLVWRMLVAAERPTVRNGVLAGGAAVLAMTWIQYNLLIAGVLFVTLALVVLAGSAVTGTFRAQLRTQIVAGAIVAAVTVTIAVLAAHAEYRGVPVRPKSDAVSNSARPLMYLLPGPFHPLLGNSVGDWVSDHYRTVTRGGTASAGYANIYLGIPLMLIGASGLIWTGARLRRLGRTAFRDRCATAGIAAAVVALVGLVFSAPPQVQVLGLSIPMPYSVVNDVSTAFRAAHRFAILAMLGLCILAGLALSAALRNATFRARIVVLALLSVLIGGDLWARPPQGTAHLKHPAIYDVLKHEPSGIVAEYPQPEPALAQNLTSLYQDVHEHPLFDGYDAGTESESRKMELQYLLAPRTVPDLAAYGVGYVVVHAYGKGRPSWLPRPGDRVPGLKMIAGDTSDALYLITARPSRTTSYALSGFNGPEGTPPKIVRWLSDNGGKIELRSDCDRCEGDVSFTSGSFVKPRMLTIRDTTGRVLHRQLISIGTDRVRFTVRFSRRLVLVFDTDPAPVQINEVIGGEDTRHFGVFVSTPLHFKPRADGGG
jgi:hypothetical protein